METTKRRGFVQRMLALVGGAIGATALPKNAVAETTAPTVRTSLDGAIRLHMHCRHRHGSDTGHGVCRATLRDQPEGKTVGEFHANSFHSESALGSINPFAASNIEMQTIRLADGTLFGMGANNPDGTETIHAVIGGTGRFAGARGTYTIRETSASEGASEITIQLMS